MALGDKAEGLAMTMLFHKVVALRSKPMMMWAVRPRNAATDYAARL